MLKRKFNKCRICGKEEKYVEWVHIGNDVKRIWCCINKCSINHNKKVNK